VFSIEEQICSSIENTGIEEVYDEINNFLKFTKENNYFFEKRKTQNVKRLYDTLNERIISNFYSNKSIEEKLKKLEQMVKNDEINPFEAVDELV
jgi:LAO/AO transport system kinase